MTPVLRVCFDANVWVAFLLSESRGDTGGLPSRLIGLATGGGRNGTRIQLVLNHELIDTVLRVLTRQGITPASIVAFISSLTDLAALGPTGEEPGLLLSGRDQIAMHDREDAGILASCFAQRADMLVTDNLRDFKTNDAERLDTRTVRLRDGVRRQLFLLIHERQDGIALVVMHPVDAFSWLDAGRRPTPDAVRAAYGSRGSH